MMVEIRCTGSDTPRFLVFTMPTLSTWGLGCWTMNHDEWSFCGLDGINRICVINLDGKRRDLIVSSFHPYLMIPLSHSLTLTRSSEPPISCQPLRTVGCMCAGTSTLMLGAP